ncbi:TonB-dependent receptor plug domain-containing protein [Thermaurantiacus sp.]
MPASILVLAAAAADPDILVSASRLPVAASEFGGSVTILDRRDLERLQLPILSDVLRLTPGLSVSRNGGPGTFTAVRIRGAEGEQTTVILDGVKVNDVASPGGGYDFGGLAALNLERVEVLRGPQSLAWGSQGIGGVVAVTTREPAETPELLARLEGGSRGTALAAANASGRAGRLGFALGATYARSEGWSAFAEARGGTERDSYEAWGSTIRLRYDLTEILQIDARGRLQWTRIGIDGFPPPAFRLADTPERAASNEASGLLGLRLRPGGGRLDARLSAEIAEIDRRTSDPRRTPAVNFRSDGRSIRVRGIADLTASSWLTLTLGAEHEANRLAIAYPSSFDPDPEPFRARDHLTGAFAQALVRPLAGLTLSGGIRHDRHSEFGGATTAAASLSLAPGDGPFRVKASYGEGFKAPTLFQLFSDFGNPGLGAESARGFDAGVEWAGLEGRMRAAATGFRRTTRNQIDFVSCFQNPLPACQGRPFGTYDNIARTRSEGLEATVDLAPTEGLRLGLAYTFLDARNESVGSPNRGRRLARRPDHTLALNLDWQAPPGWSVGATLAHQSESFDNASNTRAIPGFVTLDLRAAVPLGKRVEAYGRVTNLLDKAYETASFYGAPGRQVVGGVRARF